QRNDSFNGGMRRSVLPTQSGSIAVAKSAGAKVIPETDRIIRSLFVKDIRDLPRVASLESPAPLCRHAHQHWTGEHCDARRRRIEDHRRGRGLRSGLRNTFACPQNIRSTPPRTKVKSFVAM